MFCGIEKIYIQHAPIRLRIIMAKACIVYFSQTGNTETVAYTIAGKLEDAGINTVAMQLSDVEDFPEVLDGIDLLGVGFPTFFGYCPPIMMDFLSGLKEGKGEPAFVFTTYGGCTAGDSLYDAAKILAKKGYRVVGGLKSEAADNYPQSMELKLNQGRPNDADLRGAEEFAALVAESFKAGKSLDPERLASRTKFFVERRGKERKAILDAMRKAVEGEIIFKKELCLFCESCRKSCPTKSIGRGEKFPEFSWKCVDGLKCYQCVRVCPGKALQVRSPCTTENYQKFLDMARDSDEEKRRLYVVA